MKNFNIIELTKFRNASNYQYIEDGIYNDLNDIDGFSTYRIAVVIKFGKGEKSQQALEKQLESYFVHIEEMVGFEENDTQKYILGGELEDLQKFLTLQNVIHY